MAKLPVTVIVGLDVLSLLDIWSRPAGEGDGGGVISKRDGLMASSCAWFLLKAMQELCPYAHFC